MGARQGRPFRQGAQPVGRMAVRLNRLAHRTQHTPDGVESLGQARREGGVLSQQQDVQLGLPTREFADRPAPLYQDFLRRTPVLGQLQLNCLQFFHRGISRSEVDPIRFPQLLSQADGFTAVHARDPGLDLIAERRLPGQRQLGIQDESRRTSHGACRTGMQPDTAVSPYGQG